MRLCSVPRDGFVPLNLAMSGFSFTVSVYEQEEDHFFRITLVHF